MDRYLGYSDMDAQNYDIRTVKEMFVVDNLAFKRLFLYIWAIKIPFLNGAILSIRLSRA